MQRLFALLCLVALTLHDGKPAMSMPTTTDNRHGARDRILVVVPAADGQEAEPSFLKRLNGEGNVANEKPWSRIGLGKRGDPSWGMIGLGKRKGDDPSWHLIGLGRRDDPSWRFIGLGKRMASEPRNQRRTDAWRNIGLGKRQDPTWNLVGLGKRAPDPTWSMVGLGKRRLAHNL